MMRVDGIAAEIIFPTIGLYVWNLQDPALGRACCREYNDWLYEHLGNVSSRVKIAGMVPDWSGRRRDRRSAAQRHPRVRGTSLAHRRHARVEPQGVGATVGRHRRNRSSDRDAPRHGHDMLWYRGPGLGHGQSLRHAVDGTAAVTLARSIGCARAASVVAFRLRRGQRRLDGVDDEHHRRVLRGTRALVEAELAELPSFYIRRQIHATSKTIPWLSRIGRSPDSLR
jgi:hypothetical protein